MNVFGEFSHNGSTLTGLEYKGRPAFLLTEAEEILGYVRKTLAKKVRVYVDEGELEEGEDFALVKGSDLKLLKTICPNIGTRQSSALLLFESGLVLLAMLAKTDVGREVRLKLRREIIPAFKALQSGSAVARPADPELLKAQASLERAQASMRRVQMQEQALKVRTLRELAAHDLVGEHHKVALHARAVAIAVGDDYTHMLPVVDERWNATGIAKWVNKNHQCIRLITANAIGRIGGTQGLKGTQGRTSAGLDLKGNERYGAFVSDVASHTPGKQVQSWHWNKAGRERIVEELVRIGLVI